ncbi:MAG: exodeoxyribonuclease VII large subunit [Ruminococcus sp.]|nr:exodeoxyribonuclease VII large subunit [Ruminococcus sp.]
MSVVTVTQINKYIGFLLKGDCNLGNVMIKGEISDCVKHSISGHCYFTLKDDKSSIKAVMFSSDVKRLNFTLENGMSVVVTGRTAIFERDGVYQIYVKDIIADGKGRQITAFEKLKDKLSEEGLFSLEHKRKIPEMPKKIGVVTSLDGAAVRDIISVISRRYPICEIYAVNTVVQGENAPDSVCSGITQAENAGCDVIIVGRGGGSHEDLSAFDTEKVVRAVYNCKVPVISAVGHETDFTVTDLVADIRTPTPSAAAEIAVPSLQMLYERIAVLEKRSENAFERYTDSLENQLNQKIAEIDLLSPLKILMRGYSLTCKEGRPVKSSEEISEGGRVEIRFGKGGAAAEIISRW